MLHLMRQSVYATLTCRTFLVTAPFESYIHSVRWPLAHEHEGVGDRFVVVEEVPLGVSRVERLQSPETPVAGILHNRPAVCEPPLQFSSVV